jgi:hypothetical protein
MYSVGWLELYGVEEDNGKEKSGIWLRFHVGKIQTALSRSNKTTLVRTRFARNVKIRVFQGFVRTSHTLFE